MVKVIIPSIFLALIGTLSGCQTPPRRSTELLSYHTIAQRILSRDPELNYFDRPGPFAYDIREDFILRVNADEIVKSDLYLSDQNSKAPLLIFQHGNYASKSVHRHHAERAASWGFHCLVVEQPNRARWIRNGQVLGDLAAMLYRWPGLLNHQFNREQIILIGHSFGGSAATIAAADQPNVAGLILLDPALVSPVVKDYLSQRLPPVILLGADPKIFRSRRRETFYKTINAEMVEVSVAGATHNDAQYPNLFEWSQFFGLDQAPSPEKQKFFTSAIIAGAFSLASTGETEFAWQAYQRHRDQFVQLQRK